MLKTSTLWRFALILVAIFLLKLTVAHAQHKMRVSVSEYKADVYIDGKLTTKKGSFEITVPKGGCVEVAAEAPGFERQTVTFCQDKKTKLPTAYQMTLKKGSGNSVTKVGEGTSGGGATTKPQDKTDPDKSPKQSSPKTDDKAAKAKQTEEDRKKEEKAESDRKKAEKAKEEKARKEPEAKPEKTQASPDGPRLGIRAAGGLANGVVKGNNLTITSDMRIGALGGLVVDLPLSDLIFVQSGLMYALKGGRSETSGFISVESSSAVHYVEVPINLGAKFDLGGVKPFIMAGPYVAAAVAGSTRVTSRGRTTTESLKFGNGNDADSRRFDFGATAALGVELGALPLQILVGYDYGLANLVPGGSNDFTSQNRFVFFGVNYFFK
jgi:hypothetical protein